MSTISRKHTMVVASSNGLIIFFLYNCIVTIILRLQDYQIYLLYEKARGFFNMY